MTPEYLLESIKTDEVKWFDIKSEKAETLEEERSIVHLISTSDIDRVRDIMMPKGMVDKDFEKTPSVWYAHSYKFDPSSLPIGKSLWRKKQESGVLAKTKFAETKLADDVYQLHKGGFISTWSIGWRPILDKNGLIDKSTVEFNTKNNTSIWHKWELLEYSSAPRPSNINAQDVQKALTDIEFKSDTIRTMMENILVEVEVKEQLKQMQEEITQLKSLQSLFESLTQKTESDKLEIIKLIENKQENLFKNISIELPANKMTNDRVANIVKRVVGGGK